MIVFEVELSDEADEPTETQMLPPREGDEGDEGAERRERS